MTGKMRFFGTLAAVALLALGFTDTAAAGDSSRIAVVNVTRVFNAYKKVSDIQERLKARFDARRRELEQKEKNIREFQDIIQLDVRGGRNPETDPELFKKVQQLREMQFALSQDFTKLRKEVEKFRMEEMKEVLKDIRGAIRDVGQAEGFDLVLRAPEYDEQLQPVGGGEEEEKEAQTAMELVRRFRENPVLFHGKDVDVTEKVINKLNSEFTKANPGGAAPAPAPAPPPGQ
ncbi:MAG: OmpH family outer membrane protein [Planctomycetota bacterium]|nr:OmpH family outer membrane protein [Planctomycetota bacterium]